MAVYFVTGKLGNGKSLASVGRMFEKLETGCPVATNIDLNLDAYPDERRRDFVVYRVPNKPTIRDLEMLGVGNDTYDEDRNGLLVLDECGSWFNARGWNDKSREPLLEWFRHARKLGWDVIFIVQSEQVIDKQCRDSFMEHLVQCRRLDRMKPPLVASIILLAMIASVIGVLISWRVGVGSFAVAATTAAVLWATNSLPRLPRLHIAKVYYSDQPLSAKPIDRWIYRGNTLFGLYDTKQAFYDDDSAPRCLLTPWHLRGRYSPRPSLRERLHLVFARACQAVLLAAVYAAAAARGRSPWTVAAEWGVLRHDLGTVGQATGRPYYHEWGLVQRPPEVRV